MTKRKWGKLVFRQEYAPLLMELPEELVDKCMITMESQGVILKSQDVFELHDELYKSQHLGVLQEVLEALEIPFIRAWGESKTENAGYLKAGLHLRFETYDPVKLGLKILKKEPLRKFTPRESAILMKYKLEEGEDG